MRITPLVALVSLVLTATAFGQSTSLTRTEVAALKAKIVKVQEALGGDPAGYIKEPEEFSLPTDFNPARDGKYWPITSGVTLRYKDAGAEAMKQAMDKFMAEYPARLSAALASGKPEQFEQLTNEMTRMQAAAMAPAQPKQPMQVYVQLNQNPTVGIDPDAVVLERPGVIVLRDQGSTPTQGDVTVYADPVALRATQELSKIELRTADDGMANRVGVYHVVIQINGTLADAEAWARTFDYAKVLSVIDAQ